MTTEITHHTYNIRIAPRKMRLVIDKVRHMKASHALQVLPLVNKRGAADIQRAVKAAMFAAEDKNLDPNSLVIQQAWVDEAKALKRTIPQSRGRASLIMKKYSHIGLVLKGESKVKASKKSKAAAAETTEKPESVAKEQE
jgi:large subunit ribosomal protein L22